MTATATAGPALAHPRFRERRATVADANLRARNRRLVGAGILVLTVLLAAASTQSPLLDVDEVRVVGAARQHPELIRSTAALSTGEPLLGLDLGAAEERLALLPGVARVHVDKTWGGLVTISVVERVPVAQISSGDRTLLIADDGVVVEVVAPPTAGPAPAGGTGGGVAAGGAVAPLVEGLPMIRGAMFDAVVGDEVPEPIGEALMVAAALPSDIGRTVAAIRISVDNLVLDLGTGRTIELGDARDLEAKFDAARAVLGQVDLRCLQRVNVSAPTVPVVARSGSC